MHNIATIYRFNTPFLDFENEKENLVFLTKKIKKSLEFDWISFEKTQEKKWNYYCISYVFEKKLWKIEVFYISNPKSDIYHLPIFKLNIFIHRNFIINNDFRKKTVKFLNNIFECFDWLDEKEFLIDIDNSIYYKKWFFSNNIYPSYDFSDINVIQKTFENNNWIAIIEDFIHKFWNKEYELTYEKSKYFYTLHGYFLYFIYLVFLMYQNMEKTKKAEKELENSNVDEIFEWHINLVKKRLAYIKDIHNQTFEKYKNRLELFFKIF